MHTPIMRALDPTFPDLPPASFDEGIYESIATQAPTPAKHEVDLTKSVRTPIKIARAIAGDTEIRLLKQTTPGADAKEKPVFILEHAVLSRYHATRIELTRTRKGLNEVTPLSEADALKKFESAVTAKYPAVNLRADYSVQIHQILL